VNTRKKRLLYTLLVLLVTAAVITLILFKGPLAPVEVVTVAASRGNLHPTRFGVGTVEALRSYDIGPSRSGRLLNLEVDEGARVQSDQVLGMMDPVDLEERLRSGHLAVRRAEQAIRAARARLQDVVVRLKLAKREEQRYVELGRKKQVSQDQVDQKVTTARSLVEQQHAAQADLEAAQLELGRAQADLAAIEAQIDDLALKSPVDGLVIARKVDPGSVVMAGTPVLQIVDTRTIWVRARFDQKRSGAIRVGQRAEIQMRRNPERILKGHVARLELVADSLTEERWVNIAFEQIPEGFAIGSLANVTIHLEPAEDVLWIPSAALHRHEKRTGVWLLDGGRATFRPVEVGIRTLDGKAEIRSGLEEGEEVITYTEHRLKEGLKLQAKTP